VYCAPVALVKKIILVHVSREQQEVLRELQSIVTTKFMPFAYSNSVSQDIPSLGDDYSPLYGYAQEH